MRNDPEGFNLSEPMDGVAGSLIAFVSTIWNSRCWTPSTCKWIICDRSEFKAMEWAAIAVSGMWKKGKLVLSALSNCWITAQFVKLICWYGLFCGGAYLMFLDTSWSSSTFGMGLNHCFGVIKFHSHPTQAFNPTTCKASRDPCTPMRSSLTPFSPAHPCSCHSHATCDMP